MIRTNGELAALYRKTAEFLERHPEKVSIKQVPVLEYPGEMVAASIMLMYVADLFRESEKESYLRLEVVKKIEEIIKDPKLFLEGFGEFLMERRRINKGNQNSKQMNTVEGINQRTN